VLRLVTAGNYDIFRGEYCYLDGDALGTSRYLFAFARDGFLPSWLSRLHPRMSAVI
jgi:hypothetical protein